MMSHWCPQRFRWQMSLRQSKLCVHTASPMIALRCLGMHRCHQHCFCLILKGACGGDSWSDICHTRAYPLPHHSNGIELRQ